MAAQDGRVALAFDGFEARPPDMRQDMPLPACHLDHTDLPSIRIKEQPHVFRSAPERRREEAFAARGRNVRHAPAAGP
jgi:hypothetical protein